MRKITFAAIALATLCASGFAETVILKSGEKIDGKITGETDTEITMDVKVSAGITDVRTVPKSDVAKVEKELLDETAWLPLKALAVGANSLPSGAYDTNIKLLKAFVAVYPESSHVADAKKALAAFEEEKKRVDDGDVKLAGAWISKEEVAREKYQINATLAFNYMKDQSTRGELVPALITFDAIEANFPGARIFPDAVDLARRIIAALGTEVNRRQQLLKTELADREAGLKIASDANRAQILAAVKSENASAEAAIAAAQKLQQKWPPFIPHYEQSLTSIAQKIPSETQRLATIEVGKERESLKLTDAAKESLSKKEYTQAEESLSKAKELWGANELATRLQTEVGEKKSIAATAPAEVPAPMPEAKPESKPMVAAATEEEPIPMQSEDGRPFLLTIGGAITVVIVLIAIAAAVTVYRKIKGKANDILE